MGVGGDVTLTVTRNGGPELASRALGGSGLASSPTTSHGPSVRCAATLDTWMKVNRTPSERRVGSIDDRPVVHVAFSSTVDVHQKRGDVSGSSIFDNPTT